MFGMANVFPFSARLREILIYFPKAASFDSQLFTNLLTTRE